MKAERIRAQEDRDPRVRMRAAVAYLNDNTNPETESGRRVRAFAFLSIVHPEIPLAKRLRMAAEIAKREGEEG